MNLSFLTSGVASLHITRAELEISTQIKTTLELISITFVLRAHGGVSPN